MSQLLHTLSNIRAPLTDEKAAQHVIALQLDAAGVAYEREARLGPGDIVDFMIGDVAVEVKIKGNRASICRQLERYAEHKCVNIIILLTARSILLPDSIGDKPVYVISLSKAWL